MSVESLGEVMRPPVSHNPYPIMTLPDQTFDTLFMAKTAKIAYPLGQHIPI